MLMKLLVHTLSSMLVKLMAVSKRSSWSSRSQAGNNAPMVCMGRILSMDGYSLTFICNVLSHLLKPSSVVDKSLQLISKGTSIFLWCVGVKKEGKDQWEKSTHRWCYILVWNPFFHEMLKQSLSQNQHRPFLQLDFQKGYFTESEENIIQTYSRLSSWCDVCNE